jgi:hypothetical protein
MTERNGGGAPVAQLVNLCKMFSSDFDGEVTAAARRAHALVVAQDWSWEQLLADGSASTLTEEQLQRVYSAGLQRGEAIGYQRGIADAAVLAPQGPNPRTELGDDVGWAERVLDAAAKAETDGQLTTFETDFSISRREAIRRFGRNAYM